MPSDLAYFAFAPVPLSRKLGVFLREHPSEARLMIAHTLGAVDAATAASNIAQSRAWVAAHPLPRNASPDAVQARALLVAALNQAAAKNATPEQQASAVQQFVRARTNYEQTAAAIGATERPSGLMADLDHLSDTIKTAGKYAALGIGLYYGAKLLMYGHAQRSAATRRLS